MRVVSDSKSLEVGTRAVYSSGSRRREDGERVIMGENQNPDPHCSIAVQSKLNRHSTVVQFCPNVGNRRTSIWMRSASMSHPTSILIQRMDPELGRIYPGSSVQNLDEYLDAIDNSQQPSPTSQRRLLFLCSLQAPSAHQPHLIPTITCCSLAYIVSACKKTL